MKAIKVIIFLVASLLLAGSASAGWGGTPTEKSIIMIRNAKDVVVVYQVEYQNHNVKLDTPFRQLFVAGGEIQPGKERSISFNGYPIGAILRLVIEERDEHYRYKIFYNKTYVLKELVNVFYIHLGQKELDELEKEIKESEKNELWTSSNKSWNASSF